MRRIGSLLTPISWPLMLNQFTKKRRNVTWQILGKLKQ